MERKLPEIIAVDFDDTIVDDHFPEIGPKINNVVDNIKRLKDQGVYVILWTCRSGQYLTNAVEYCRSIGLEFDSVNENLKHIQEKYGLDTRKVFADYYIDDKSLSTYEVEHMPWWNRFL